MNTLLTIGNNNTTLTLPDGSRHAIALGIETLCAQQLRRMPPGDYEWETAIMTVEDAIAPMRALLPPQSTLHISGSGLQTLADADGLLTREAAEQAFQRISRYGNDAAVPQDLPAYARLLLVREWLHHMGFASAYLD